MGKQTAAAITKYNDEDPSASLEVIQKDIPANLQEGEVLVRLKLRPIKPSDMFCMRGRYGGFTPQQLPAIPGLEGKVHSLHVCMQHAASTYSYALSNSILYGRKHRVKSIPRSILSSRHTLVDVSSKASSRATQDSVLSKALAHRLVTA